MWHARSPESGQRTGARAANASLLPRSVVHGVHISINQPQPHETCKRCCCSSEVHTPLQDLHVPTAGALRATRGFRCAMAPPPSSCLSGAALYSRYTPQRFACHICSALCCNVNVDACTTLSRLPDVSRRLPIGNLQAFRWHCSSKVVKRSYSVFLPFAKHLRLDLRSGS